MSEILVQPYKLVVRKTSTLLVSKRFMGSRDTEKPRAWVCKAVPENWMIWETIVSSYGERTDKEALVWGACESEADCAAIMEAFELARDREEEMASLNAQAAATK